MDPSDKYLSDLQLSAVFAVGAWVCLGIWLAMVARVWQGKAVLSYQPRRPVPWRAFDLVVIFLIYIALQAAMFVSVKAWLGPEITSPPVICNVERSNASHVVARLVSQRDAWILLLCCLSAVVVAPIVEEFMFRVLLQGYLETIWRRWRRVLPTLRLLMPGAVVPIVITSLLFGRMHFRVETPMMDTMFLASLMVGNAVAGVITMACAVVILRRRVGATAVDVGFVPEKFFADVALGLAAFLAVAAPIYMVQMTLTHLLPKCVAADPFTLFLLSLALGTLYYYTHRIVPSIVVHMSLNATSLAIAWFMYR